MLYCYIDCNSLLYLCCMNEEKYKQHEKLPQNQVLIESGAEMAMMPKYAAGWTVVVLCVLHTY